MAPKSVTFRRHDHLVSVLFGDLLSHSYNITFSMFSYLVTVVLLISLAIPTNITFWKCFCILFIYFLVVALATTVSELVDEGTDG